MAIVDKRTQTSGKLLLIFVVSLIGLFCCQKTTATTSKTTTQALSAQATRLNRLLSKRSHDRDFAPKLIHQPHGVTVQPNKPHTSECPVESQPESDVKWFKDNKLLESEPMHLEQTGSELMFFLVNDRDTGDYHCEATNYLGTVSSEQFRLTVQTSELDESIAMEPRVQVAAEQQEQPAEFKCTLPAASLARSAAGRRRAARLADLVSWRKNGRRLQQVVWTDAASAAASAPEEMAGDDESAGGGAAPPARRQARFTARQGDRQNEFVLSVARLTRARDDNSTFTCLFQPDGESTGEPEVLARESRPALLRVLAPASPVKLSIPMGAPMDPMGQAEVALGAQNHTTQLHETGGSGGGGGGGVNVGANNQQKRIRTSLGETLADLYEIARPTILILGALSLVAVLVLLQLLFVRRRAQANRYTKHHQHHHHQYSSASSSSANSNSGPGSGASSATLAAAAAADPVLSSLLSRTLSAPSASSLSVNAGKKYRFYRDHMRKVAAAITNEHQLVQGADFIDAAAYFEQQQQQQQQHQLSRHQRQEPMLVSQLFANGSLVPNLYNQSLAAREQARSLLQANAAGEHMRSLGNLNAAGQQLFLQQQHQPGGLAHKARDLQHAGHNLELPTNFAHNGRTSSSSSSSYGNPAAAGGPLEAGAANLLAASNRLAFNQFLPNQFASSQDHSQQQQHQPLPPLTGPGAGEEHYQLVSCSSISPSSTSSIVAGSTNSSSHNNNNNKQRCDKAQIMATTTSGEMAPAKVRGSVSSNHYSSIDANEEEEEEDRYEELDQQQQQQQQHYSGNCKGGSFARTSARSSASSSFNPATTCAANQQRDQHFQRYKSPFFADAKNDSSADANQPARLRSSLISSKSTDSSTPAAAFGRNNFGSRRQQHHQRAGNPSAGQGQLSPYAVSSISNSGGLAQQQQQRPSRREAPPPAATQPPPVTSEALQALNEQFDINHLLKLEQQQQQQHSVDAPPRLPFTLPPPPPPTTAAPGQAQRKPN